MNSGEYRDIRKALYRHWNNPSPIDRSKFIAQVHWERCEWDEQSCVIFIRSWWPYPNTFPFECTSLKIYGQHSARIFDYAGAYENLEDRSIKTKFMNVTGRDLIKCIVELPYDFGLTTP